MGIVFCVWWGGGEGRMKRRIVRRRMVSPGRMTRFSLTLEKMQREERAPQREERVPQEEIKEEGLVGDTN